MRRHFILALVIGWVLWRYSEFARVVSDSPGASPEAIWEIVDAFESFAQCRSELVRDISLVEKTFVKKGDKAITRRGNAWISYRSSRESTGNEERRGETPPEAASGKLICLPTGVDPR